MSASVAVAAPAASTPCAEDAADWIIELDSGLRMALPPSLRSLSTYALLEQQHWFEPEVSLLPHLLVPGTNALDIGANHGVYALEMARLAGTGHVWAFEPTFEPRRRLQRSVDLNGLGARITCVAAGLADEACEAEFALQDNSELNSRTGRAVRRETVQLLTLDGYLASEGIDVPIGFVKLDAEGDELRVLAGARRFFERQSPVVMFEFRHGERFSPELGDAFAALGFGIFRWSAELALLLPFDHHAEPCGFALNLVAVRPAQQQRLAEQGVLATADALARSDAQPGGLPEAAAAARHEALRSWCAQRSMMGRDARAEGLYDELVAACGADYADALAAVAAVHLQPGLTPAERVRLMRQVQRAAALGAADAAPGAACWQAMLAHALFALGQRSAALAVAQRALQQWRGDVPEWPVATPQRADMQRERSTPLGSWLCQVLREFVACRSSFSGCFGAPQPALWGDLLCHPDHGAEVERRHLLTHALSDRAAAVQGLVHLPPPAGSPNAAIWHGLVQAMRAIDPAAALAPAAPEDVLAGLPEAVVSVVDVGASGLADAETPYAALLAAGRARVTGFEPDARALSQLQRRHAGEAGHRYLPHVVGDGKAATFHATTWSLTSSLLEPNRPVLDRYQALGELVVEAARAPVVTVRLDDVIAGGGMDLLKVDVQGGELQVFQGAAARLAECLVVWTEVEFLPLYRGQPLFGDIDAHLRGHGLQFLSFVGATGRALKTWPAGCRVPHLAQQLWSDAVYVPGPERLAALDAGGAARLALIAHHVVGAFDLCHAALLRFDALQGGDFAARYARASRGGG